MNCLNNDNHFSVYVKEEDGIKDFINEEIDSLDIESQNEDDRTPLPNFYGVRRKTKLTRVVLPATDEQEVVEWLQQTPWLYDRGEPKYLDTTRKQRQYDEKATTLRAKVTGAQLRGWVDNMRSRYGKLVKKASGDADAQHSERDMWILNTFSFLSGHIKRKKTRNREQFTGSASAPEPVPGLLGAQYAIPGHLWPHSSVPTNTQLAQGLDVSSDEMTEEVPTSPPKAPPFLAASTSSSKEKRKRKCSDDPSRISKMWDRLDSMVMEIQNLRNRADPEQGSNKEVNQYCSYVATSAQDLPPDLWMELQNDINAALTKAKLKLWQRQQPPQFPM